MKIFYLGSIGTLLLSLGTGVCHADDATHWLNRMGVALHDQDYQGTFIYMRCSQLESIQVTHQFKDGRELERLVYQNGEEREIVRRDNELVCYHPDPQNAVFDHNLPLGPFSTAFNDNPATSPDLYRFRLHGKERIAGRTAVKLKITPRHDNRFGYRLWLDEETGLLLQSQMVDRNRVLELFQFSSIQIGQPIDSAMLNSSFGDTAALHQLSPVITEVAEQQTSRPVWRVSWLPDGFKPMYSRQSNLLHFTDGLATLSVFVEQTGTASLPDMTTSHGATTVITRRLKNAQGQITVVGEVPVNMARRVAESVEPAIF